MCTFVCHGDHINACAYIAFKTTSEVKVVCCQDSKKKVIEVRDHMERSACNVCLYGDHMVCSTL